MCPGSNGRDDVCKCVFEDDLIDSLYQCTIQKSLECDLGIYFFIHFLYLIIAYL
jgi:hypothetical protein